MELYKSMHNEFKIDDLIRVAKRENNTKRRYLYVNPMQGKHIPVSPSLSLELFGAMARDLEKKYAGERVFVIGFAETATAIGSAVACGAENVRYYMNTTREDIPGARYLFFTESHSHATEQRLVTNGLAEIISRADRIVFAEDEVTTGNTIVKLIDVLKENYDCGSCGFGITSILNSMSDHRLEQLQSEGIGCSFIKRIPPGYMTDIIDNYTYKPLDKVIRFEEEYKCREICLRCGWNCRVVNSTQFIRETADRAVESFLSQMKFPGRVDSVLVLGTEEFMFPAMYTGMKIEQRFPDAYVRFHATTRSPIETSGASDYPLHERRPLLSLYDDKRNTFIYNIARYDCVILMTDARPVQANGLSSLLRAVIDAGNTDITLVRWEA